VVVIGNFEREGPDRATLDALRSLRRRVLREGFGAEVKATARAPGALSARAGTWSPRSTGSTEGGEQATRAR
jgi:hypothetical protein